LVEGSGSSLLAFVTLDVRLANRLPDVEILTAGGPGVPALAACYASLRKLTLTDIPADHDKHPGNTVEQRDERLVEFAHAAVLVGSPHEVRGLLDRMLAKLLRLEVMATAERRTPSEPPAADDGTSGGGSLKSAVGFDCVIFGEGFCWHLRSSGESATQWWRSPERCGATERRQRWIRPHWR